MQQPLGTMTATLDPTTQRACDADGAKGCSIPLANGCTLPVCNDGLGGRADDHKYCRDNGAGDSTCSAIACAGRRASRIAGVPTNTRLVIRITGPSGNASDTTWATTVAWNVFLSTNDRACSDASPPTASTPATRPTRSISSTSARCRGRTT